MEMTLEWPLVIAAPCSVHQCVALCNIFKPFECVKDTYSSAQPQADISNTIGRKIMANTLNVCEVFQCIKCFSSSRCYPFNQSSICRARLTVASAMLFPSTPSRSHPMGIRPRFSLEKGLCLSVRLTIV